MANEAIRKEPLTKKERNNLFRRYMTFNAPGFDYVYYMGKSWPWWLKPFFKLFYNKEGVIVDARHCRECADIFIGHPGPPSRKPQSPPALPMLQEKCESYPCTWKGPPPEM